MKQFISHSERETKDSAKKLAKKIKGGVIALSGELGAGKTIFVQGLAEGLGIKEKVTSPTYVYIRQHKIPNSAKIFYHIDLYRLENKSSIDGIGLDDLFRDPNAIVVIEWAEKIKNLLPKDTMWISLKAIGQNIRQIIFG